MDSDRFARIKEIFAAARDLAGSGRESYLARACGDDVGLRAEVESLLRQSSESFDILGPLVGDAAADSPASENAPSAGSPGSQPSPETIGPYRILEVLGEGGMGTVYRAEQERPLRREVALKLIRRDHASPSLVARFDAERQVLARMDHPNIARILDAGSDERGNPYLVMELVRGRPVTEYVRDRGLSIRQRLQLYRTICRAVHDAHVKGIIHRDLKPLNILIADQDGAPVPKLIDFGIARDLLESSSPVGHPLTRDGRLIGTLDYMSPEQAGGQRGAVDVRSDVYSLGVVLYEMLTGSLPYRLEGIQLLEALRILADGSPEPLRLRDRARSDPADADLQAIVAKCLSRDPAERYSSAAALADDIDRCLEGYPVLARAPGTFYSLSRTIRRHRSAFLFGVSLVVLLMGYAVTISVLYRGQQRLRERAEADARQLSESSKYLVDLFQPDEGSAKAPDEITARELLDAGIARIEREALTPQSRAHLMSAVGEAASRLGLADRAQAALGRALELSRAAFGPRSVEVGEVAGKLGNTYLMKREFRNAVTNLELASDILRERSGSETERVIDVRLSLAKALRDAGDPAAAKRELREVIRALNTNGQAGSEQMIQARGVLAYVYRAEDSLQAAEALYREAIAAARRRGDPRSTNLGELLNNFAFVLRREERYSEAASLYEEGLELNTRLLGERHPDTRQVARNLATLYGSTKQYDKARLLLEQDIRISEETLPANDWRIGSARGGLGSLLLEAGKPADARSYLQGRVDIFRVALGADHVWTACAEAELAVACRVLHDRPGHEKLTAHSDPLLRPDRIRAQPGTRARLTTIASLCEQYGFKDASARYRRLVDETAPPAAATH